MNDDLLRCVEIEPETQAKHSVIWLHGLGADGHDFEPIVPVLHLPAEMAVRFIFPHAPSIPVTINMGFVMPAWYDIKELDLRRQHDEDGIRNSAERVTALIKRENERGIPTEKIVLAGFSQGGAIALHLGLRYPETFAGIMALSTYLVCEGAVEGERNEANLKTPILQGHGTFDPMVTLDRGEHTRDRLQALGYDVEWHSYPMEHAVCPEEIADISKWLQERF